jgi:hypothetical protein
VENDLKYEPVLPLTKKELIAKLESADPQTVASAIYAATKYEHDSKWVQELCIKGLGSTDLAIRWASATCLGDLAFFREISSRF